MTPGNWQADVAPQAGDELIFPATGVSHFGTNNNFTAGTTFDSIEIDATGYTFGGLAVTLNHGITTTYTSGTQTFPLDVALGQDQTFTVATGGTLDVTGAIGDGSSSDSLTKSGLGTLQLDSAANNYDGGTIISAGTLAVTQAGALGSGTVEVDSELDISGSGFTLTNPFTLVSTGNAIVNQSGNNTLSGAITLSANATIDVAATDTLDLSGIISGGAGYGVTKTDAGTLEYSGGSINTYSGATTVDEGELSLSEPANIVAVPGDLIIGDGTDTALAIDNAGGGIASTSNVTIDGASAVLTLYYTNDTIATLTMTGGTIGTWSGTLTVNGGITANASPNVASIGGNLALVNGQVNVASGGVLHIYSTVLGCALPHQARFGHPGALGHQHVYTRHHGLRRHPPGQQQFRPRLRRRVRHRNRLAPAHRRNRRDQPLQRHHA